MGVLPKQSVEDEQIRFSAEQLIQAAFIAGDNPVFVVEAHSRRILAGGGAMSSVFGYAPDEIRGRTTEFLHVDTPSFRRFGELSAKVLAGQGRSYHCYYRMKRRDGEVFDTENLIYPVTDGARVTAVVSIVRDMGNPHSVPLPAGAGADFLELSNNIPGGLFQCVRHPDGKYSYNFFRGDLIKRIGLTPTTAESDFRAVMERVIDDDRERLMGALEKSALTLAVMDMEVTVRTDSGELLWIRGISRPRRLDDGSTVWDGLLFDITEQRRTEKQLDYLSLHDPMTGLLNLRGFDSKVEKAAEHAACGTRFMVMALDVQRFHGVNEIYGFNFGDELIKAIGLRLQGVLPTRAAVARSYGDEFLLLFEDLHDREDFNNRVQEVLSLIRRPFEFGNTRRISIEVKLGISIGPDEGNSGKDLRHQADAALKRVRRSTEMDYAFYSREMTDELVESLRLEKQLAEAIEDGVIQSHYQPQYDLKTGLLCGFESLARWPLDNGEWASPGLFIPLAEQTGRIQALSDVLVRKVLNDIVGWKRDDLKVPPVAINFSAHQFKRYDFAQRLVDTLSCFNMALDNVTVEVTESAFLHDFEGARRVLNDLHHRGVRLSMDDFGTGFSSLSYLSQFPFHELKIDQSFVGDMHADQRKCSVVKGIIELGQALGLKVVAEGVETVEQLKLLQAMGCDAAQGYLFARPAPAEEFAAQIRGTRPHPVFEQ